MQKLNSKKSFMVNDDSRQVSAFQARRVAGFFLIFTIVVVIPLFAAQAQRLRVPVKLSAIAVQSTAEGAEVSIIGDGSLSRAQNWQDSEGYHVVLPNTVAPDSMSLPRGVRIRRLGSSLEVVLQTKPGANVNAQIDSNRLLVNVEGKLRPRSLESDALRSYSEPEHPVFEDNSVVPQTRSESQPLTLSSTVQDLGSTVSSAKDPAPAPSPTNANKDPNTIVPAGTEATTVTDPAPVVVQKGDEGWMASLFSGTSVVIVFFLGIFGLLVSRKLRSREDVVENGELSDSANDFADSLIEDAENLVSAGAPVSSNTSLVRVSSNGNGSSPVVRLPAGPTSLYGAYRIDQEVGKLVFGQAHRIDVLASRASDDRRAIETSLIKAVNSSDTDESARRRAREALEEYGFVARQCATLLLAPDPFERTSAARMLGDIKSPAALPFLLEGLYDSESLVRNQAVVSIGELKIPSAIGALLDIARTHPDVPSALLSRTLSACSVEGLDFFDAVPEVGQLSTSFDVDVLEEITHLEPLAAVEELPEDSDDPAFAEALAQLESDSVEDRAAALKALTQFPVKRSVSAIALVASKDAEPAIRSQAISTLGSINHESVFAAVLLGLSDETREVRAAAARTLSRLSFDRADAYVRVLESGDEETIQNVAKACVQAGIVSQNLDRLSSGDRRQTYETFALVCLLAKGKLVDPVLDAITNHANVEVRVKAVQLLASTGEVAVFSQLRELAVKDDMREDVKTALLDALYRIGQNQEEPETIQAELIPDDAVQSEAAEFEFTQSSVETETVKEDFNSTDFAFEPTAAEGIADEVKSPHADEPSAGGFEFSPSEVASDVIPGLDSEAPALLDEFEF